jgi:hypothetical protein
MFLKLEVTAWGKLGNRAMLQLGRADQEQPRSSMDGGKSPLSSMDLSS